MSNSFVMKVLAAVAMGVVLLAHLSPVAAGMLLCIGDGSDVDCCRDGQETQETRSDLFAQFLDGSDCACCITFGAAPLTAGAGAHKASLDVASGSARLRNLALPTGMRNAGTPTGEAGERRLSSLRTVVLLI